MLMKAKTRTYGYIATDSDLYRFRLLWPNDSSDGLHIQCVSNNIPDIFSCNFRKHCQIFIRFGTRVTEKVSNQ